MKCVQANVVITNHGNPILNGVVGYSPETGEIQKIWNSDEFTGEAEQLQGVLIPGYVNAHCHLELSHLQNVIPTGTGLIDFITSVVKLRDFDKEVIHEAIRAADKEMHENGIVVVGDISNTAETLLAKLESPIYYHTFVEYFDLWQTNSADQNQNYNEVFGFFYNSLGHKVSKTPHATYSVSDQLFELLHNQSHDSPISIHNQEVLSEDQFIEDGSGPFLGFYKSLGLSLQGIKGRGRNSIHHAMTQLDPTRNTLFVHNTMTSRKDIEAALSWSPNVYWVTCPNANLYIENRLPDYRAFLSQEVKMCIGTDSLSSNWQLSVYEEMRTIKQYQSTIPDIDIIKWATINGAEALGVDDKYGKIVAGATPGLNLLDVEVRDGVFDLREARNSVKIM